MSSTRRAETDADLSQERWCSAPEFNHSLNAIAVAKRAQLVRDPELKALLWFLQWRSLRPNGLEEVAHDLLTLYPDRLGTPTLRRLGRSPGRVYTTAEVRQLRKEGFDGFPLRGDKDDDDFECWDPCCAVEKVHPLSYPATAFFSILEEKKPGLVDRLQRMCLDPKVLLSGDTRSHDESFASPWWFSDLVGTIGDYRKRCIQEASDRIAATDVSNRMFDCLGFCLRQRRMVLIEGNPGLGKSMTTKTWCEMQAGLARYFEVPAGNDFRTFYAKIADALGVASGASLTGLQIKVRVEKALEASGLMLVCDEASRLWPQFHRPKGQPLRLQWIMARFDAGIPIALAGYKFTDWRVRYSEMTAWPDDQLERRMNRVVQLPAIHSETDLFKIAKAILPGSHGASHKLLVAIARINPRKGASAMIEVLATARDLVEQEGLASITFDVLHRAMATNHPDFASPREPASHDEPCQRQAAKLAGRVLLRTPDAEPSHVSCRAGSSSTFRDSESFGHRLEEPVDSEL